MSEPQKVEPQTITLTEEVNLGLGVAKCLEFLKTHGGIDDGISEDEDVDLDRVDELGRKIDPLEQYRMLCHRFHAKNPSKKQNQEDTKETITRYNENEDVI